MKRYWQAGLLCWLAATVHAYDDSANEQGKAFATQIHNAQVMSAGESTNPAEMPGFQSANPAETQYYHSGLNIENQARTQAQTDENAQYLLEARDTRPQFTIDKQTDPLFKRYDDITQRAHGLSDTYAGCVDLPVGTEDITRQVQRTCTVTGRRDRVNFTCQRTRHVSCANENANQPHPFRLGEFEVSGDPIFSSFENDTLTLGDRDSYWRRIRCGTFINTVRFNVAELAAMTDFRLIVISYDDRAHLWVNGNLVFSGVGRTQRTDGVQVVGGRCEQRVRYQHYTNGIDLMPLLRAGSNEIRVENQVGDGGGVFLQFLIRRRHLCEEQDTYTYRCSAGESHTRGTLQRQTCTSGPATRNGFFRNCWQWDQRYTRITDPIYTRAALCDELVQAGCGQVNARCTRPADGYCARQTLTFSCPETTAARTISLCGDDLVCAGGNCSEDVGREYVPATEGFTKAASSLAVLEEIARHMDMDTLTVFNGTKKECERKLVGASNCCADGGWATDANLSACTTDERVLGLEKEAGQAVYVGRYTSGSLLDQRTYQVYCTYPSKIARIFMDQGKPQLDLSFGTTDTPDCSGFTLQQIEALNFDAMDFSELYEDMLQKAEQGTTPDADTVEAEISVDLQTRYPQVQAP